MAISKVKERIKAVLTERGQWGDYVALREDYRVDGCDSTEARMKAMEGFFTEAEILEFYPPKKSAVVKEVETEEVPAPVAPAKPKKKAAVVIGKNGNIRGSQVKHPKVGEVEKADLADFEGRDASPEQIVEWVAAHIHIRGVTVGMCPSPTAWSFYQQCQSSPAFAQDFLKTVYPKYKQPDGDRNSEAVDGSITIGHLRELQKMREAAKA